MPQQFTTSDEQSDSLAHIFAEQVARVDAGDDLWFTPPPSSRGRSLGPVTFTAQDDGFLVVAFASDGRTFYLATDGSMEER